MTPVPVPDEGCEKCGGTGVRSVSVEFSNGYGAGGSVDCDCRTAPVPVPVVNEAQEQVFALLEQLPGGESRWDVACRIVALPEIKAAFEARAKLAELQAAPSGSKDLELAEAQAKLEAERAEVDRLREALFGLLVFARGNPVVLAKIHGALDGRVEDGGELS